MHQEVDRIMGNIINEHIEQKATEKKDEDARAEDLVDVLLKFHQEHSGDNEFSLTISNIKAVIMVSIYIYTYIFVYIVSLSAY
jgi:hypothetical protein